VFWVISVYFNIRNTLPKFCPFLLGHSVYIPATVPQRSEIPEGLMNYPVYRHQVALQSPSASLSPIC